MCFLIMVQRITAIEPQQKNPQRVNVYLDGEFAFGLASIVAAWLKVGQELGEEKIASLKAEDEREVTYQKALHFLSYRPRSSAEVRQNLSKRGISESLIDETVNRLQEAGLVNDEAFARAWVENRNTFRPSGKPALRMELRRKGLSDEIVQSVLDTQVNEETPGLRGRPEIRAAAGWPGMARIPPETGRFSHPPWLFIHCPCPGRL